MAMHGFKHSPETIGLPSETTIDETRRVASFLFAALQDRDGLNKDGLLTVVRATDPPGGPARVVLIDPETAEVCETDLTPYDYAMGWAQEMKPFTSDGPDFDAAIDVGRLLNAMVDEALVNDSMRTKHPVEFRSLFTSFEDLLNSGENGDFN